MLGYCVSIDSGSQQGKGRAMPETRDRTVVCREAIRAERHAQKNLMRWQSLIYAFGVALVIFAVLLLLALLNGSDVQKVVTGAGTVVSTLITGFVVVRLKAAEKFFDEQQANLKTACGTQRARQVGPNNVTTELKVQGVLPDDIIEALLE